MKTLVDLYLADCPSARKASSKGELAGPCPVCGGDPGKSDRFHVWPNEGKHGQYWCRQVGCVMNRRGDAIEYLKQVKAMSYTQACAELGIVQGKRVPRALTPGQAAMKLPRKTEDQWEPHGWDAPSAQWQVQAARLLDRCIAQMEHYDHQNIRDWLWSSRRISGETARYARLGYCPKALYLDREKWGLSREVDTKGNVKRLWIPEGIVIPCYRDGVLHRLRVRRFAQEGKKYIFIQGGSAVPYFIYDEAEYTMVVESELDAILINQESGGLVNTVALGSVSMRPDPDLHQVLVKSKAVLVALDTGDESMAGAKAAWGWWAEHYPHALRCPVIKGKDPAEAARAGLDLRTWIQAAIDGGAQRMAVC